MNVKVDIIQQAISLYENNRLVLIPLLVLASVVTITSSQALAVSNMENLMKSSPWKYGYLNGVWDGERSARDATSACSPYNSTATNNECSQGYDLGFKKGCDEIGNRLSYDPDPEYGQCRS